MKNKKKIFVLFFVVIILAVFGGCNTTPKNNLYVELLYEGGASDLGLQVIERDDQKYENPNAPRERILQWENNVWNLEYRYSSPMAYLDYDIDLYGIPGAEDHIWFTFKKNTDQVVRINNAPVEGAFNELNEEQYNQAVNSIIETFVDMPIESLERHDVTTYNRRGEDFVEGGKTKEGFYTAAENEEITHRATFYQEVFSDVYATDKHITIELRLHSNSLFVEIYDIDTTKLKTLVEEGKCDFEKDFVDAVQDRVRKSGFQLEDVGYNDIIILYSKDGKTYASFTGRVSYLDEKEKERKVVAKFAIEYP